MLIELEDTEMRNAIIAGVLTPALIAAATVTPGAPQTVQPGQPTQARVWVENRGRSEAVAVDLRDINIDRPLRVHVVNGEPESGDITNAVPTRAARQLWEYATAALLPGTDIAAVLNTRGAAGWEAVGTTSVSAEGTTILLKRPR
jgi:hypothetical protein